MVVAPSRNRNRKGSLPLITFGAGSREAWSRPGRRGMARVVPAGHAEAAPARRRAPGYRSRAGTQAGPRFQPAGDREGFRRGGQRPLQRAPCETRGLLGPSELRAARVLPREQRKCFIFRGNVAALRQLTRWAADLVAGPTKKPPLTAQSIYRRKSRFPMERCITAIIEPAGRNSLEKEGDAFQTCLHACR